MVEQLTLTLLLIYANIHLYLDIELFSYALYSSHLSTRSMQSLTPDCTTNRMYNVSKIKKHYSERSPRECFLKIGESNFKCHHHVKMENKFKKKVSAGYSQELLSTAEKDTNL